jgi:pca operon transcription factor PcaQ
MPYHARMDKDLFSSRIRLRHLHCFVAVAQEQHIGKAAAKLALSQPAVSKTLAELEEQLGSQLFERGRHGAQLTRQGELFLGHALAVLEALSAARNVLGGEQAQTIDTLHIGALPTVAPDLLPQALATFHTLRPNSRVLVETGTNATLLARLKAGELDFVLGRMADPEMMVGLAFELLYVEPLVLLARPDHPLLQSTQPRLDEVLGYPLVVSPTGTIPRHNTESFLQSRGLRLPGNCVETLSVSLARLLTLQSDYIWFAPAGAVRDDLERRLLARLPVPTDRIEEPVGLLLRNEGQLNPAAHELVEQIRMLAAAQRPA